MRWTDSGNMTGRDVQARLDALESKIDSLRTVITWGLAALGLLVAALRLYRLRSTHLKAARE